MTPHHRRKSVAAAMTAGLVCCTLGFSASFSLLAASAVSAASNTPDMTNHSQKNTRVATDEDGSAKPVPTHAVAMHGKPKYPVDFSHLDYVNPDAPKGGTIKQAVIGTFDTFNGYLPKGIAATGVGLIYDTLTEATADEPFSRYGLLAEKIVMPEDRSSVTFHLNPKARFSDGKAVTAEDVVYSFNTLMEKGRPSLRFYYKNVESVSADSDRVVTFTFADTTNRELALIIGEIPILPKHFWEKHDFGKADLTVPIGSGPYRIGDFEPGKRVEYVRNENYWAKDLPIKRGRYNFDRMIYEYYLDQTVAVEAFKSGEYDFRAENNSKFWATLYQGPKFSSGDITVESVPHQQPSGMQAFLFNLRKPLFQDKVLRQALSYAYDFEWANKNLFYGQYARTHSYFQNTELAATALPSEQELALLKPLKDKIPPEVFTTVYEPPSSDGSGKSRRKLREATRLLKRAGYVVKDNQLYNIKNEPVKFEILLVSAAFERIVLPFKKNLATLGVQVSVRKVDVPQYINRLREFDFDMVVHTFSQSLSPGNEQRDYWHSSTADIADSRNLLGLKDPAVDALVYHIIQAPSREALVHSARALDRVLQWNHLVIPNWHVKLHRLAYWRHIARPERIPPYRLDLSAWWSNTPPKQAKLDH